MEPATCRKSICQATPIFQAQAVDRPGELHQARLIGLEGTVRCGLQGSIQDPRQCRCHIRGLVDVHDLARVEGFQYIADHPHPCARILKAVVQATAILIEKSPVQRGLVRHFPVAFVECTAEHAIRPDECIGPL